MQGNESQVMVLHLSRQGTERLREMVATSKMVRLAGMESDLLEFEKKAVQIQPDFLLVEYAPGHPGLTELLDRLSRNLNRSVIIAWSDSRDPEDILTAMRSGVREYLAEPLGEKSFNEALVRLKRQAISGGGIGGKLVAIMGSKGGVGTSHLAINLAWSLSQVSGRQVALIDFDRSGGDLAFMLDLEPDLNLTDVARGFDRLDATYVDSILVKVAPGLRLLAAPHDQAAAEEIQPEHLGVALDHLADAHDFVIMDISSPLDEVSLLALDRAELVLVVVEPTLVGLKSGRRLLTLYDQLGYGKGKVMPVINRSDARGSISKRDVETALDIEVPAWLPNDTQALMEAGNIGQPVIKEKPKSAWAKEVNRLAETIVERLSLTTEPEEVKTKKKRKASKPVGSRLSLFGRTNGRKGEKRTGGVG